MPLAALWVAGELVSGHPQHVPGNWALCALLPISSEASAEPQLPVAFPCPVGTSQYCDNYKARAHAQVLPRWSRNTAANYLFVRPPPKAHSL